MAIPNEQAMEASRTGGVLSPASKNPNSPQYVEYAGLLSSLTSKMLQHTSQLPQVFSTCLSSIINLV